MKTEPIKKWALLKLENNSNKILFNFHGTKKEAIEFFTWGSLENLNEDGYLKKDNITFCIAEYYGS